MELDLKVGVVSSVNEANTTVKVFFPDADNMVSDWLYVLQNSGEVAEKALTTDKAGKHTHSVTVDGSTVSTEEAGEHDHTIPKHTHTVKKWMPKVKDRVLCIMYASDEETDGFVLGAIK